MLRSRRQSAINVRRVCMSLAYKDLSGIGFQYSTLTPDT